MGFKINISPRSTLSGMEGIPARHIRVAKVVGENDDGLTLFVPKNMSGTFHVQEGDRFLTLLFTRAQSPGVLETWIPWD